MWKQLIPDDMISVLWTHAPPTFTPELKLFFVSDFGNGDLIQIDFCPFCGTKADINSTG